ncbi:MAG: HNH endonuclease [Chloroflexi bacterium]|nr:HNH endonuclease [Chloroflexota bacterium]
MTKKQLREIVEKTNGHCHFCGNKLDFDKRGWRPGSLRGYWEVDHVTQRAKGGARSAKNCLPACTNCNRLRWHRNGITLRRTIVLEIIARREIHKNSDLGKKLKRLRANRRRKNIARRETQD